MKALEDSEFRGFVIARGSALVRSAYVLTGDQQLAEDLIQSALEKTARHWGSIRFAGAAESYVRRTMYRDQVSIWRRRRVNEDLTDVIPEPRRPESAGDQVEERLDLAQALNRLGRRQRAILVLRFYEDLTEREVAELLGISVGTVKSQTFKALHRLRVASGDLAPAGTRGREAR
ncbi:MAG TPA: SigE family RNA polymerase sigma factor [Actinomycetales bacterium]|nr:SigE family RNA polymerase sigma factor [Actinomycetales bacterium]